MIQSSIAFFLHHINNFFKNIVEEILKNLQYFSTYLLTHFPSHTCSSSKQYLATLTKITQIGGA